MVKVVQQVDGLFALYVPPFDAPAHTGLTWEEAFDVLQPFHGQDGAIERLRGAQRSVLKMDFTPAPGG